MWKEPLAGEWPSQFVSELYASTTLYVPHGTKENYEAVEPWKNFANIVEIEDPDIFTVDGISYHILSHDDMIVEVTDYEKGDYSGEIVIPETVTHDSKNYAVTGIERLAFCGCTGLTSVSIPGSVKTINDEAFNRCSGLTSVAMAEGVTTIGMSAFQDCTALTSVAIPEGVTSIDAMAFANSGLTSVEIPASVAYLGEMAFHASSLTNIDVAEENQVYRSVDGVLYDVDVKTLLSCPVGRTEDLVIPESVTTIGMMSMGYCQVSSITIPASVTKIESHAFVGNKWGDDTRIYCNWQEPIECTDPLCITDELYKATLYVPEGTKEKYESMEPWNKFSNIVEAVKTGIENVQASQNGQPEVTVENGVLMVNGVDAASVVTVYNMQGRTVYSGIGCATVNLPAGIYIVSAGVHTAKVVLR